MEKRYDFVFLTNTPSFYKINLCNQIALSHSVLLVLYGYGSEAVNTQLDNGARLRFDYIFLFKGDSSKRNKLLVWMKLILLMSFVRYNKVLYSGWFVPEYNALSFFISKKKNCVICESSSLESYFSGIKGWLKKKIINRMGVALPSGEPHRKIFESIGFKGRISVTGGVGIFNKQPREQLEPRPGEKKYIYVGRLIECKNVRFLIENFNRLGKPLTIVGTGDLEKELKALAKSNITFMGFVENEKLGSVYQQHDIFVLPSKTEPWGLVVEEALYYGLPVVVSDHVGSSFDMVKKYQAGCIFELGSTAGFDRAIEDIELRYDFYADRVAEIDFDSRDKMQIKAYTDLID